MSKKKSINVKAPEFQEDPRFRQGIDDLFDLGGRLTSFDFSGNLSPLQDAISLDPEVTRLALEQAQAELGPAFEDSINQIKQEAAAANQLESSTFTDSLARTTERFGTSLQGITAGAALEDRTRALNNRLNIFGLGAGLNESATGLAGQSQEQRNQFNLTNFENQLAAQVAAQGQSKGGLAGALSGGIGGAALGIGLAPFTGGASLALTAGLAGGGALAGGLGPSGTGGQILNAGSMFAGARARPGSSAGNTADLFGGLGARPSMSLNNSELFSFFGRG